MLLMTSAALSQEKESSKVNVLDEVVISDTKFAQSKEKSGKVITKITQDDLQKKSGQNVAQVLSTAVGVEINRLMERTSGTIFVGVKIVRCSS